MSKRSLQQRFEHFHDGHPEIYSEFRLIAHEIYAARGGEGHYGAKAIMEVIRYHRVLSGRDRSEPFKINNSYISRYARLLIDEDKRFAHFFETRPLRS